MIAPERSSRSFCPSRILSENRFALYRDHASQPLGLNIPSVGLLVSSCGLGVPARVGSVGTNGPPRLWTGGAAGAAAPRNARVGSSGTCAINDPIAVGSVLEVPRTPAPAVSAAPEMKDIRGSAVPADKVVGVIAIVPA
jgi:hypothetical protein